MTFGTNKPLIDAGARERIRDDLDTTLVVEAAAGTGKTTALVERVLSILKSGKGTLRTLVAVTFTEKAAGEMKLRLRTEIERARTHAANDAERANLNRALTELEAAHIGTIHAFCADLLRERPVEANVDPLFEVASEGESERIYDEAFTRWFHDTLKEPGEGVSRVLRRATRERDQDGPRRALQKAGFSLIGQRDFPCPYERPAFDRGAAIDDVVARLANVSAYAAKGFAESWLTKSLHELRRASADIARRHGDVDAVEAILRTLARHKCWGWKGSGQWFNREEGILRQTVLDERAQTKAALDAMLGRADADLAALLYAELTGLASAGARADGWAAKGVVRTYEELKARSGKLDFLDLLALTRDLLATREGVRRELQARYTHLLVDEFQDTDPLQAEILLLLASDDPSVSAAADVRVLPGKLFVVGDPKQSIYRFRRADVSLYETVKARLLEEGANLVHLRTSFRSAPSIQSFVNAAFEPLMVANASKSQATYVPLAASRPDPQGRPTIVALPVPRPYSDYGRITSFRIDDSFPDAAAAFVDWLVNRSGWTITERGGGEPVKVEARHVCLLFKRLQSFGNDVTRPYVRALEARRIPHVLVGGKSFHEREEVIAVRSAISAVEWPDDAMSVYAALHGPFFALGDDALLAFKHAQRHLHPLRRRDEAKLTELTRPVADALAVLAELHVGRNRRPIADTLAMLLEATRAHAGIAIWPAGEQALGNVLRVLDMARRFEQESATSFRAFVTKLEDDAERGGANEAPVVEEGTDGVRIMTVHRAKGLEFPVVVLVDPTANATHREPSRYIDPERKLWAAPLCGASPKELLERREELLEQDREEAVRLLYVATTRARELLVVPALGDVREDAEGSWLEPLDPVLYPEPRKRRSPEAAPGCPAFGEDTVLERPETARTVGVPIKPGLHRPQVGSHEVVFWDPRALILDREDEAGLRQQKILAVDDKGIVAKSGVEQHAAWKAAREASLARASKLSIVIRTVTEEKQASDPTTPVHVPVESTNAAAGSRPSGKRFGTLVHAVLATVPLDADVAAIADVARVQGRLVGALPEEIEAARDAVREALGHPLFVRARKAERVERETAVMLRMDDGSILEGVVDLAFAERSSSGIESWVVVDFKTDVELGARQALYAAQVSAYARAIAKATGKVATPVLLRV